MGRLPARNRQIGENSLRFDDSLVQSQTSIQTRHSPKVWRGIAGTPLPYGKGFRAIDLQTAFRRSHALRASSRTHITAANTSASNQTSGPSGAVPNSQLPAGV